MEQRHLNKYKNLGLNIAYYRKKNGLSQIKFSDMIGISRTHMNRIENAECAVSLDVVFNICEVLSVSPSQLFDFRE